MPSSLNPYTAAKTSVLILDLVLFVPFALLEISLFQRCH